jgi:hypothetical protein
MCLESDGRMIYWQGKTEELGAKAVPVQLCPPQITHGLTRVRTRAFAVRGRRLTTWATARQILSYYASIRPEGLRKTMKNLNQDSRSAGPRFEPGTSQIRRRSVNIRLLMFICCRLKLIDAKPVAVRVTHCIEAAINFACILLNILHNY